MDLIALQRQLKFYTDDILQKEMMQPSGMVPSYLVLAEINRRKETREKKGKVPKETVKDEMTKAPFSTPFTDPQQAGIPFGVPQLARGGIVGYYEGSKGPVMSDTEDYGFAPGQQYAQAPGAAETDDGSRLLDYNFPAQPPSRSYWERKRDEMDRRAREAQRRFANPNGDPEPEAESYRVPDPGMVPGPYIPSPKSPETDYVEPKVEPTRVRVNKPTWINKSGIASVGDRFDLFRQKYEDTSDPYAEVKARLAEIDKERRGRKGENLGLSLMEWGAGIAASKSPWLGQALGESGIAALKGYRAGAKDMREEEMAHLGAQAKLAEANVAYKRGEFDKAFKLYQEANLMQYRQQSLAAMAARGDKSGSEMAKFALDSWKSANDSWQNLTTKDAGTGLAAMKMRIAADINRDKPEKERIKYTDVPDELVRRRVFQEYGVPHDLPQRLLGFYDQRIPGSSPRPGSSGERVRDYDNGVLK